MLNKIAKFFDEYKQFGLVLATIVASLLLDLSNRDTIAHIFLGVAAIASAVPLAWGMIQDLRDGKYGIDVLAVTAIVSSVLLHEYWTAMIIVLMLTGGEALEDYAENRAKRELTTLLNNAPKKAHVLKNGKEVDVAVGKVEVGDKIIIKTGEVVPVDAVVVEGTSSFDESSLTGESLPIEKKIGDTLLSGSINQDSTVVVRASATARDSQYEQIIKLVKSAASTEAPFVRLTDRYAVPFTIVSFAIAGTVWAISGEALRFLQVIVVATPCPLLLAAPIALISGMSRAAKHGIIIKNGSSLEKLATVKTVGFDKTGTLTHGIPVVNEVTAFKPFTKNEVLEYASALERGSSHVLAKAIVTAADKKKLPILKATKIEERAGHGLVASIKNKRIVVGKLEFLKSEKIQLPAGFSAKNITTTATLIAVDGALAGIITFSDEVRKETSSMLKKLTSLGILHTLMVTGDNKTAAATVAKKLHISEVVAEALPADKVLAIENAPHKPIAFVGDGVNDAPVLTAADVGIALGARGSTAASESADVVIMLDDVSKVAQSIDIAKRTFTIAKQTILIGIGLSIILQLIFATGKYKPVYGAFLQEVVDVVVIINALRAHTEFKKRTATKSLKKS
jgi:heavy metal translocating P-type ATPase